VSSVGTEEAWIKLVKMMQGFYKKWQFSAIARVLCGCCFTICFRKATNRLVDELCLYHEVCQQATGQPSRGPPLGTCLLQLRI